MIIVNVFCLLNSDRVDDDVDDVDDMLVMIAVVLALKSILRS
jgi:hypothetical protein